LPSVALAQQVFKGVTEPVNEAIISASVDGTIKEILVKEGDWVNKDDPLIRLYRREQELEVALRYKLWQNKSSLKAAKIHEKNILELYTASRILFEKNHSVSKEELTKLKIQYDQSQIKRIELEIREEQERIQYEIAKEQLAKRVLKAPINAVITKIYFQAGERSKANQQLVKLVNPKNCYFNCNIEECYAASLSQGKKVQLQIQTGKTSQTKTGEVVYVAPVVDPASGLMKIKVLFDNSNLTIRPGVSGQLMIK
jgi:RND family efflux transporter MFP subunit